MTILSWNFKTGYLDIWKRIGGRVIVIQIGNRFLSVGKTPRVRVAVRRDIRVYKTLKLGNVLEVWR
jgi:hypothetical protein